MRRLIAAALGAAAVTGAGSASAAELIVNGGFETNSLAGWSQSGQTDHTFTVEAWGMNPSVVPIGRYQAALGPEGGVGNLYQTLGTVAGQSYTISFSLANLQLDTNASFVASFDGIPLVADTGLVAHGYIAYRFTGLATSDSTVLKFAARHDQSFFILDGVSVVGEAGTVPEPAGWAMLILGAGTIGAAMRRRAAGAPARI